LMKHFRKMLNLTFSLKNCWYNSSRKNIGWNMLVQHFRWKMLQHFLKKCWRKNVAKKCWKQFSTALLTILAFHKNIENF
jgi:hypothetical protein